MGLDSAAVFTPSGLDVLPALSKVCDELAARLKVDIDHWNGKLSAASANWKYDATTEVGKLVQSFTAATKESEIAALAGLNQTDSQRLADLRGALKADPLQKAKETRAAITRLGSFATRVGTAASSLADGAVEQTQKQLEDATTATEAAKKFAAGKFDTTYLAGTGSDVWRKLWDAARQYSASSAYPNSEYPAVSGDARCVLCQQELDEAARLRFSRFDAFCKDKSQQLAVEAERLLAITVTQFKLHSVLGQS